jgi:hypothetical protein
VSAEVVGHCQSCARTGYFKTKVIFLSGMKRKKRTQSASQEWGCIPLSCDLPRIQTVILGLFGILGRPKIPEFIFDADSESVLSFAVSRGPKLTV